VKSVMIMMDKQRGFSEGCVVPHFPLSISGTSLLVLVGGTSRKEKSLTS